eukprot:scaffold33187_cov111-Isochrysis_galbana.AAC.3
MTAVAGTGRRRRATQTRGQRLPRLPQTQGTRMRRRRDLRGRAPPPPRRGQRRSRRHRPCYRRLCNSVRPRHPRRREARRLVSPAAPLP